MASNHEIGESGPRHNNKGGPYPGLAVFVSLIPNEKLNQGVFDWDFEKL